MKNGKLTVFCGCMFAGKTTALLNEIKKQKEANKKIKVYKPLLDNRYAKKDIKTHDGTSLKDSTGIEVITVKQNHVFSADVDFIAIDEVQFFNAHTFIENIVDLLINGVDVAVAGLELDSDGKPFGPMPNLLLFADVVEKHLSTCVICKEPANRTFRKVNTGGQILVGGANLYEPRCITHWYSGLLNKT